MEDFKIKDYEKFDVYDSDRDKKAFEHYKVCYKNSLINTVFALGVGSEKAFVRDNEYFCKKDHPKFAISGDRDFNFNDKKSKVKELERLINKCSKNNPDLEDKCKELLKTLEYCKKLNTTMLNISLMPVTGGLNNTKASVQLNPYDRLDTFIYMLNDYYNRNDEEKYSSPIIIGSTNDNKQSLVDFLALFKNIDKYCEEFYFISPDLVQKMIESGGKDFYSNECSKVLENIEEYLNVAIEYWGQRAKKF